MDIDLILRIVNVIESPITRYRIAKLVGANIKTVYNTIEKMLKLGILVRYNSVIALSGGNVFKLTDYGTFLVFFGDKIPVVLNCPFWNTCELKHKHKICFGEKGCPLLQKILEA